MSELVYTLLTDGSSDAALMPILTWLLRENGVACPIQSQWADLRPLTKPPKSLIERIETAVDLFPCNLLFVHRDAEKEPRSNRVAEITASVHRADKLASMPVVCVVPVRMQEAWLLIDESAIRWAAGNPNGHEQLSLPPLNRLEFLPDPKATLAELIRDSSGLHGRRRKNLSVSTCVRRVTQYCDSFDKLRALPAFVALEADVASTVEAHGWNRI